MKQQQKKPLVSKDVKILIGLIKIHRSLNTLTALGLVRPIIVDVGDAYDVYYDVTPKGRRYETKVKDKTAKEEGVYFRRLLARNCVRVKDA